MIELKVGEYDCVLPLMSKMDFMSVTAYAVIENKQPGTIYVNRKNNPGSALIVNRGGKYLLVGDPEDAEFNRDVSGYLSDRNNHWVYFDLFASSEEWLNAFMDLPQTVTLYRYSFSFDETVFRQLGQDDRKEWPAGYEMKRMDKPLFQKYAAEMDDTYPFLWSTAEHFLEQGFGYCILHEDQFVSACNSFSVARGYADPDIGTVEKYRRAGFALSACTAFMNHCLQHHLTPNWDCDAGNQASLALATKLGFAVKRKIRMLWWHENKNVMTNYLKNHSYI